MNGSTPVPKITATAPRILILRGGENTATPLRISFDAGMRRFLARAIPGMIASSGPQLLMVTAAVIASATPSAVSWLYFANRLIELPLGLVGVAIGTVLVRELSGAVHSGDMAALAQLGMHPILQMHYQMILHPHMAAHMTIRHYPDLLEGC